MGLAKGKTNNPNGRPPGSQNKTTKELRELISAFVSDNWMQVQNDFEQLEPKEKLLFMDRMLKHVLPTLSAEALPIPPIKKNLPPWMLSDDDEGINIPIIEWVK